MSSRVCSHCGCTDIDIDSTRGDAVCTGCGSVLEDQIIVSEVQFQENSGGGSSLIGQFVSSEGPGKSLSMGGSFPHGMQKESRTITLQNGKKRIQQLAAQMKLNQHCVDTAFNFFKMAVAKRVTRGRKVAHVIAAALYLVCRTEKTPHMLLDFSDALQVNVFILGKTYLHLSRELCINLPDVDPCLYIPRFAHALEFSDKTHEVSMTAMRLVQRMKRDWMATGRRPSGLCGAALLVAARIHDFSRTTKEIVKVVKVCQSTLRKRLYEFEETPSSQLTIEEFQNIDLEEEQDPPCFTEAKRRARKIQEQNKLPEYETEVSKLQKEIEDSLFKQKMRGPWAAFAKMDDSCSIDSDTSRLSDLADSEASCDVTPLASKPASPNIIQSLPDNDLTQLVSSPCKSETSCKSGTPCKNESIDIVSKEMLIGSDIPLPGSEKLCDINITGGGRVPSLGLGVEQVVSDCLKGDSEISRDGAEEGDGELDLTGLDDEELDQFLLSEREVLVKTKIWMAENGEFLKEQKLKEEKKAREAEEELKKPPEKRKKKIIRKKRPPIQEQASAQEAIQKVIQEKKISCKINYDVLNDLNIKSSLTPSIQREVTPVFPTIESRPSISRLRKSSVSFDLKEETGVSSSKRVKLAPMLPPKVEKATVDEVVVESGPVQYAHKDEGYGEDEEDAEDYYEEEDHHLSAAQLFGHTGVEEDYDDDID